MLMSSPRKVLGKKTTIVPEQEVEVCMDVGQSQHHQHHHQQTRETQRKDALKIENKY